MSWVGRYTHVTASLASNMRLRHLQQAVCSIALAGLMGSALAATPAGTIIRNQASATYLDTDGRQVTVTSNLVQTTIEQVPGVTLVQDQNIDSLPNTEVRLSHRVRNTGNGTDRFDLQLSNAAGDNFEFSGLVIYADEDQNGIADNTTPITQTPWLAPDEEYYFVVAGQIPTNVANSDIGILSVTTISNFSNTVNAANTDFINIVDGPIVTVSKSISQQVGLSPSGDYVIALNYSNSGNADASDVAVLDALPDGMSYVPNSARWNNGASVLTDVDPTDVQSSSAGDIIFCAYQPSCTGLPEAASDNDSDSTNQVTALISDLPVGVSGTLTFNVSIDADLPGSTLYNIAEVMHNAADPQTLQYSNSVAFTVLSSIGVVANGSTATSIDGMNEPVNISSAAQGTTVKFSNIVWNTGSNLDTFNIELDQTASTFPAGTIYRLLKADGATPLLDTNGDGVVDTGPLQAGEHAVIVLSVDLPQGVAGDNGGVGFSIPKLARSVSDANIVNSVEDHLDEIIGNSVDLTNQAAAGTAGALGAGPGPELSPVSTVPVNAQGVAQFDLFVRNQGQAADQYQLVASLDVNETPLPADWAVEFRDATTSQLINNTAFLQSGQSAHIVATVTAPSNLASGTFSIYFKAESLTSGTSDKKHDAISISQVPSLHLEPNLTAQLEPGGSVVYEHVATNTGQTIISGLQFAMTQSQDTWSAAIYEDTDSNGFLSPADQILSAPWTLAVGESRDLFVKVFAPANAALQQQNITHITASWNGGSGAQVHDISTVSMTNVSIRKEQAVDVGCDGSPDAGTDFGPGVIEVSPGNNCVIYRLTATNKGVDPSYNVTIHDYTPPYTLYVPSAACSRTPCWLTEPQIDQTGTVNAETDQLLPGDSFSLQFSVRVQ